MTSITSPSEPLSVVFGGGGMYGIGYGLGVAHGLRDGGFDVSGAPMLGTSAGSWVATALALGIEMDAFEALEAPRVPNLRPGVVFGLAHDLFGDARHERVRASMVSLAGGRHRIVSGRRYRLAHLIAASSAVPGLFAPHIIKGIPMVDGGVRSATSADRARPADHLVVVAPLASGVLGPAGRYCQLGLDREVRAWRAANPGAVTTVIAPERRVAKLVGANPMAVFDADRARDLVYPLAYDQGRAIAAKLVSAGLAA